MDDMALPQKMLVKTIASKLKKVEYLPVISHKPKKSEKYISEDTSVPCLVKGNIKGRYIALKSANDRQVIAVGFTRTLAYKRALRKGHDSCIVISNY